MGQSMKFAFCRAVRMSGMRISWAMMPGMAVSSAPDRNAENGKAEPDRPAILKTKMPDSWRGESS